MFIISFHRFNPILTDEPMKCAAVQTTSATQQHRCICGQLGNLKSSDAGLRDLCLEILAQLCSYSWINDALARTWVPGKQPVSSLPQFRSERSVTLRTQCLASFLVELQSNFEGSILSYADEKIPNSIVNRRQPDEICLLAHSKV